MKLTMKLALYWRVSRVDFKILDNINTQENKNSLIYGTYRRDKYPTKQSC